MIPAGTLCIVVGPDGDRVVGSIGPITSLGPCTYEHHCECWPDCHAVCGIRLRDGEYCVREWSDLRPITPPSADMTVPPREVETA